MSLYHHHEEFEESDPAPEDPVHAQKNLIELDVHPTAIRRASTDKTLFYDEYMYTFVLRPGVDLEYLKKAYPPTKTGKLYAGIHHIMECLEANTEDAVVICKMCFDNHHQPFSKAVSKQGFTPKQHGSISVRFSNWIRHLKDTHGIESPKVQAGVNAHPKVTGLGDEFTMEDGDVNDNGEDLEEGSNAVSPGRQFAAAAKKSTPASTLLSGIQKSALKNNKKLQQSKLVFQSGLDVEQREARLKERVMAENERKRIKQEDQRIELAKLDMELRKEQLQIEFEERKAERLARERREEAREEREEEQRAARARQDLAMLELLKSITEKITKTT
jgi:hypothetical protein